MKQYGTELLDSFVDPLVIRHPKGHTIPRFGNDLTLTFTSKILSTCILLSYCPDEKGLESMLSFLERMQKDAEEEKQEILLNNTSLVMEH